MKVRKMAAALAAISMLAAFSAQAVAAADTVTISAEKVTAEAGAEFTLKVELGDVPAAGISVCEFALEYDASLVTITGVAPGAIAENGVDSVENFDEATSFAADFSTEGLVTISYSTAQSDAAYCISESGVYAIITGTVAADAAAGASTPVSVVPVNRETKQGSGVMIDEISMGYIDADGAATKYTASVTDGSVTVSGEGTSEETGEKPTAPDGVLYGDVDDDGDVDIVDVIVLNKYLLLGESITPAGETNADVDLNGQVNATDSLNILKAVVKIITLPV